MFSYFKKHFYIIGIIYAVAALIYFPKWTVDDAYITCRYADNLARHGELTWNVGEDPIEGYTGIVLPVVLALFIKLGISPVLMGKIIGILSFFIGGYILNLILKLLKVRSPAASIVLIMYFTAPFMFVHAYAGLETLMFSMLILWCVYLFVNSLIFSELRGKTELKLIILLIITSLARPEGVILSFCILSALGVNKLVFEKHGFRKYLLKVSVIFILPCLLYFLWRWNYYGMFLPNTFYAKGSEHLIEKSTVLRLALFTILYLSIPAVVIAVINLSGFKGVKKQIQQQQSFLLTPAFLTAGVSIILFAFLVISRYLQSRLLMNFEFRFFVPFFPLFLIFAALFLEAGFAGLKNLKSQKKLLYFAVIVMVSVLTFAQIFLYLKEYKKYVFLKGGYLKMIESEHIPAGLFVKERTPASEWVAVIHDVGAIPYFSQRKVIDFSRLNDEVLSQKNMTESEIVDYFFSFDPGAVVITSYKWDEVYQPWIYGEEAKMITSDPRFSRYLLVKKFRTDISPDHPAYDYFEFVYLREDLVE